MTGAARVRVAMVHGPAGARLDGVGDYVEHLVRALPEQGVEVHRVPVRPRAGRWSAGVVAAARQVRRLRPDVVHVQFAPSAYRYSAAPGLLAPLLPHAVPLVTTVHEYGWWAAPGWVPRRVWSLIEHGGRWDRETGRLVPASTAVVTTNAGHAGRLRRRARREPVTIPLAANVEPHPVPDGVRPEVRHRLGLDPRAPLLVFFGFVHPVKGVRYLLEAMPALRADHPDVHLVVAGGFTSQALPERQARAFRQELESLADRCGVRSGVTFTGHLPAAQVSRLLHAADVAVLPFTAGVTAKSGALLAVLAHGLPAAVTVPDDDGAADDALADGREVAVIPARRDPAAVAATVRRLLDDAPLRHRLADGGRRLAAGRSWEQVAAAHRRLYEQVLGERHG